MEERLPRMKMIKQTLMVNGNAREVWGWNRRMTDKEFKRSLKRTLKLFDKVIAREKLKEELSNSNKAMND